MKNKKETCDCKATIEKLTVKISKLVVTVDQLAHVNGAPQDLKERARTLRERIAKRELAKQS